MRCTGYKSDPAELAVQDPRLRKVAVGARIECGCRLVNWEREDLGNKIVRLGELETNTYERSPGVGLSG